MYANTCPSDTQGDRALTANHQRINAAASVSFKHDGKRTRLDRLYQQGSAKLRFPKVYNPTLETVLINTAGGLTGGDRLDWSLQMGKHASVVATTQACEKSYRTSSGTAQVSTSIQLEEQSVFHWLPQETICYDGSSLSRSLTVEMKPDAEFLGIESIVLGRDAMGESIVSLDLKDRWRIKRDNRLVMADDLLLTGDNNSLAKLAGNGALASLLFVSPKDEETMMKLAGELQQACNAPLSGFSAFCGRLTGRVVAQDSYHLRKALTPILEIIRGTALPRVWRI